jgi:hypothetical protein
VNPQEYSLGPGGSIRIVLAIFRMMLLVSVIAAFSSTLLLVTSHLFYGQTYILDTGYWIGLSTGSSPTQLLESSGINANEYSYFNTHYSPIFSFLQVLYAPLRHWLPPAGFFLLWFTGFNLLNIALFAATLMLSIKRLLPLSWEYHRLLSLVYATALVGCSWLITGSASYIISYITYPHTEIIGLQLSYIGLFLLVLQKHLPPSCSPPAIRFQRITAGGLALIVIGSLFHELVGLVSIYNLLVLLLAQTSRPPSHALGKPWPRRGVIISLGMIGVPLLGWLILRLSGYFTGSGVSAMQRIYIGNNFSHVSLDRYLLMLGEASNSNRSAVVALVLAIGLCFYLISKGYKEYGLFLLVPIIYVLASPLAADKNAATLQAHYGYPIQSIFYLFAIGLAITWKASIDEASNKFIISIHSLIAIPVIGSILTAGISIGSLLRRELNTPHTCSGGAIAQRLQKDTCISRMKVGTAWFNPSFIYRYISLGNKILRRAESTFSQQINKNGKLDVTMSDHSLAALFPDRFQWKNVLAQDQIPLYLQGKLKPAKGSHFIRYHVEDGLWNEDVLKFLNMYDFHVVSKKKVGNFYRVKIYEYIWSNADASTAAN